MANTDEQDNEILGAFTAPDPVTYTAEPDGTNVVLPNPDLQSGQNLKSLLDAYMEKLGKPEDIIKKSDDPFDRPSFNVKSTSEDTDGKALNEFMDIISKVESSSGTDLIQDRSRVFDDNSGPGTGYFQWEVHGNAQGDFDNTSGGAWTRIHRAYLNTDKNDPNNQWLGDLWNKSSSVPVKGKGRVGNVRMEDIMNLTKDQQYFIQGKNITSTDIGNKYLNIFKNATTNEAKLDAVAEYWLDDHWAGHGGDSTKRADKKKWFLNQAGYGVVNRVFNSIKSIGEGF